MRSRPLKAACAAAVTLAPAGVLAVGVNSMNAPGSTYEAGREEAMSGLLWESLQRKLLPLPDELEIYPGHQAGSACGAGLSGKPSSTFGFEKRWNPALSLDKAAFVRDLIANIPARPAEMERIFAANVAA